MTTHKITLPSFVSYRQFDVWARKGYIRADATGGSGNYRSLPNSEYEVLTLMGKLVHSGFTPRAAATTARELIADGQALVGPFRVMLANAPLYMTNFYEEIDGVWTSYEKAKSRSVQSSNPLTLGITQLMLNRSHSPK